MLYLVDSGNGYIFFHRQIIEIYWTILFHVISQRINFPCNKPKLMSCLVIISATQVKLAFFVKIFSAVFGLSQ